MHVTACLSPLSLFLSLSFSISLDKEKVARHRLSLTLTLSLLSLSPTKYVFICVNFCQKDSGNYHVWATGFPYISLRRGPRPHQGGLACSAWSWLGGLAWVLCINYRPTRRVPNQCLHFYLFCWGATGNWHWSWGIPWGLRS